MKKIQGFEGKLSLAELSKVSDLIYFDGPFLSVSIQPLFWRFEQ